MNLPKYGWNIIHSISIVSQLKGAYFVKQLKNILPQIIQDMMHKPAYDYLINIIDNPINKPNYKYNTISTSWPLLEFDGCVYKNETQIDDENHIHIPNSDHRLIFADIRLFREVYKLLV